MREHTSNRGTHDPVLGDLPENRGLWHETADEVEEGLRWGAEKARLLRWVRRRMRVVLTERERDCVELHYFRALPYTEVAPAVGLHPASVARVLDRALRKLRRARELEGLPVYPRRGPRP